MTTANTPVSINLPGEFKLCWRASASFIADGRELTNTDCTTVNV